MLETSPEAWLEISTLSRQPMPKIRATVADWAMRAGVNQAMAVWLFDIDMNRRMGGRLVRKKDIPGLAYDALAHINRKISQLARCRE